MKLLKPHPLANCFPRITPEEQKELNEDIRKNGLIETIVLHEGMILDGRHRYQSCLLTNTKIATKEYQGKDPAGYVISANIKRRHLEKGQRAMIAATIANLTKGRPEIKSANLPIKQTEAAKTLGVSARSIGTAKSILSKSPTVAEQVVNGQITLSAAKKKLEEPKPKPTGLHSDIPDRIGRLIPNKILPMWQRAESEAKSAKQEVSRLMEIFKEALESNDVIYCEAYPKDNYNHLASVKGNLERAVPWSVCTKCQGATFEKCDFCKGRGFISKFLYETCVDEQTKKVIATGIANERKSSQAISSQRR